MRVSNWCVRFLECLLMFFLAKIEDWTHETSMNIKLYIHFIQNRCITTSTTIIAWEMFYVLFSLNILWMMDESNQNIANIEKIYVLNCQLRQQRLQWRRMFFSSLISIRYKNNIINSLLFMLFVSKSVFSCYFLLELKFLHSFDFDEKSFKLAVTMLLIYNSYF